MNDALLDEERSADAIFESAAELFGLLSSPIRLQIIHILCDCEMNVTQLLEVIDTTQPNISQHLSLLYRTGILGRKKNGAQIYYRLKSKKVALLCKTVWLSSLATSSNADSCHMDISSKHQNLVP